MKSVKKQIETLFTAAKERGLSPMWTHFYRYYTVGCGQESRKELGGTACVLLDEDQNVVARGMTIVSLNDNGDKSYGRLRSLKRAYDAAVSEKDVTEEYFQFPEYMDPTDYMTHLENQCLVKAARANAVECLSTIEQDRINAKRDRIAARRAAAAVG